MITEWFAPLGLDDFRRQYFQHAPLATAGRARGALALLDWDTMGRVVASPSRWWHLVKCVEDSLSLSIGVMPLKEPPT